MIIQLFDRMEEATEQAVGAMLPQLSPQRRDEALQYKHTFGQFCCAKSFLLLRDTLVDNHLIHEDDDLAMERDLHGKPRLLHHPHIFFNISHCKHAIAVAVDDAPIGVDVESFRDPSESLLRYTMSEQEAAMVLQSATPAAAFAELWTRKEALYKYLGTGIQGDIPHLLDLLPEGVQLSTQVNHHKSYALTVCARC